MARTDNDELIQPVSMMFEKEPVMEATDIFKIYHIQLPVFRKEFTTLESVKGHAFYTWLYLFANGYKDEEEEMNMLAGMSEGLKNFAQRYNVAINDSNLVRLYRLEQDAIRDEKSRMGFATKEARQEGRLEAHRADALGMKNIGIAPESISKITGLSINEIMSL